VDLLPHGSFTKLLGELKNDPSTFPEMMENLWGTMNTGGLSPILRKKLPRFNGGLFAHSDAIAWMPTRSNCSSKPAPPTGAMWNPPSSAPCWNVRWTRANATSWARTTRRAPMWNAW
jgi:hypothetical protein